MSEGMDEWSVYVRPDGYVVLRFVIDGEVVTVQLPHDKARKLFVMGEALTRTRRALLSHLVHRHRELRK